MIHLLNYNFVNYFRTYKYIPPLSIYILVLVVNYTYKPNPILDSYSLTALYLFFLMGWITVTIFHAEHATQQDITMYHCKSSNKYFIGLYLTCTIVGVVLSVIYVLYPIIFDMFHESTLNWVHVTLGIMAHFSLSFLAISLAALFTHHLISNSNNIWWGVLSVFIISLATPAMQTKLDASLQFLLWLLPPTSWLIKTMGVGDQVDTITPNMYFSFSWIFFYSALCVILFFALVRRKNVLKGQSV